MAKLQLTVRLDEELLEKLKVIAEIESRSVNGQYEYFVKKGIADYEQEHDTILYSDQ